MEKRAEWSGAERSGAEITLKRLEMREWEASRSRTESPWSASKRRLRESMWDAARLLRSPTVDMEAGAAKGEAAARGDLGLGFAGEEGERKLRSAPGDAPPDGEETPEREAGLGFALGLALALGLGLGAAAVAALAFLMASVGGSGEKRWGLGCLNFEP